MSNQTNKKSPNNRGEIKEKEINMSLRSIWLGMRDSNPRSRNQNPLPYHLANPHCWNVIVRFLYRRQNKFVRQH